MSAGDALELENSCSFCLALVKSAFNRSKALCDLLPKSVKLPAVDFAFSPAFLIISVALDNDLVKPAANSLVPFGMIFPSSFAASAELCFNLSDSV